MLVITDNPYKHQLTNFDVLHFPQTAFTSPQQKNQSDCGGGNNGDEGDDEEQDVTDETSTTFQFFLQKSVLLLQNLLADLLLENTHCIAVHQSRVPILVHVHRTGKWIINDRGYTSQLHDMSQFSTRLNDITASTSWNRPTENIIGKRFLAFVVECMLAES